jgi:hypothetical protein
MTSLKPIKGWKSLIERINEVIAGVNARTISVPLGGGIDMRETSSGTLIALSSSHVLPAGTTSTIGTGTDTGGAAGTGLTEAQAALLAALAAPPSGTAAWQSINVIDNSTGSCVIKSIQYWGTAPV